MRKNFKVKMVDRIAAILLMGGMGTRVGDPLPKQFHKIGGRAIYLHTLKIFLEEPFDLVILVVPKLFQDLVESQVESSRVKVIVGGSTRQESSYLGLLACPKEICYVMIHDAVRPFVTKAILDNHRKALAEYKAVDTCIPTADTIVTSVDRFYVDTIPLRDRLLRGQTPQSFERSFILKAHEEAIKNQIIESVDDCSLVLGMNEKIYIVKGEDENFKITNSLDLFLADQLLFLKMTNPVPVASIRGKIFAVTGATGGIGSAICVELEKQGATVLRLSPSSTQHSFDATDPSSVESLFAKIYEQYGEIDGLINSMGVFIVKPFADLSLQEISQTLEVNLHSVIYCCKYAKIKEGGHIVNISSSSYTKGRKNYEIYSAAKAAIVNFSQGLSDAIPNRCINVVVPERTNTKLRRNNFPDEPLEDLLDPSEVALKVLEVVQSSMTCGIIAVRK